MPTPGVSFCADNTGLLWAVLWAWVPESPTAVGPCGRSRMRSLYLRSTIPLSRTRTCTYHAVRIVEMYMDERRPVVIDASADGIHSARLLVLYPDIADLRSKVGTRHRRVPVTPQRDQVSGGLCHAVDIAGAAEYSGWWSQWRAKPTPT